MTENIKERIPLITKGLPLTLDSMTIRIDSGKLLVTGFTKTFHFKNVNKEVVILELENLKISYSELSNSYKELKNIVQDNNLEIQYNMDFDTGKAGIGLCSEINGDINWYIS